MKQDKRPAGAAVKKRRFFNRISRKLMLFVVLMSMVLLALVCLVRCILGPRISDRVMAINMIGTLTIIMVVVFTVYLKEAYLADIALIYAMISFLSVVVLCKVYTGIYRESKHEQEKLSHAHIENPVEDFAGQEKAGEQ